MFELFKTPQPLYMNGTNVFYNKSGIWGNGKEKLAKVDSSRYYSELGKWKYNIVVQNPKDRKFGEPVNNVEERRLKSIDDYLKLIKKDKRYKRKFSK